MPARPAGQHDRRGDECYRGENRAGQRRQKPTAMPRAGSLWRSRIASASRRGGHRDIERSVVAQDRSL